jgi:hypothetical protein
MKTNPRAGITPARCVALVVCVDVDVFRFLDE